MSWLWTTEALVEAMNGRPFGQMPEGVQGISIDTRSLQPGDAFFAIKGETMDGHDFATAAIKAGAQILVVAEGKLPALGRLTAPMIVVPDVLVAMEQLAQAARARTRARVIAVTGSAGKTTTKEALRHVLGAVGLVHASVKSFNNHWGVPLTLARLPENTEYAVFEIGMNHPGEIRPLVKMVRPHVAIVTLVAAAHLGFFSDLDEIAAAKAEVFEGIEPEGAALINCDDPRASMLGISAREAGVEHVLGFGEHQRSTYRLINCVLNADHSTMTARVGTRELVVRVGTPGRHMVQNALAVLGAADLVGADIDQVAVALGSLPAQQGRGRQHRLAHADGVFTLIDESYNANPASMKAGLDLLDATPVEGEGRRIAVLGDMLELGDHADELHAQLAELIVDTSISHVLLAGPHMKALAEVLPSDIAVVHRDEADDLGRLLIGTIQPGDVVMIKSSKGIGFYKIVEAMLEKFPAFLAKD